jgi:hypothetical protein
MSAPTQRWKLDLPLGYLAARYPIDLALMSESGRRDFALRAVLRTTGLNLHPERGALRYLDLMVLLGYAFEDDPQLPWAQRALNDSERGEEQMASLWDEAVVHVQRRAGLKGMAYRKALLRARALPVSTLVLSTWTEAADGSSLLASLYPEKLSAFESCQDAFFDAALQHCQARDEKAKGVVPLYQVLMLLLGSGFERDPRYRWATHASDTHGDVSRDAYARLHASAIAALDALPFIAKAG